MFCPKCGSPLEEGGKFCPACGAKIEIPEQAGPTFQMPAQQQIPQQPMPAPMPVQTGIPGRTIYTKGCLAQAFADMTGTPGVFKRILQIALLPSLIFLVSTLMLIVPFIGWLLGPVGYILGFASMYCGNGYAIEWGRELARGRGFDLNAPLLRTSTLSLGFFSNALVNALCLLALLPVILFMFYSIAGGAGIGLMFGSSSGFIWILGIFIVLVFIAGCVLTILLSMFAHAAVMHLAVTGRVESAFSLGKVWKACKSQLGKLFCAVELPGIMVGAATGLFLMIFGAIMSAISGAILYSSYSSYSYYGGNPFIGLLQGSIPLVIFLAIALFIGVTASVFTNMLKYRAVGHWAARYAQEWAHEGDEDFALLQRGGKPHVSVHVDSQPPVY